MIDFQHLPVLGFQETVRTLGACVRAQQGSAHSRPCPIVLMGQPGSGRTAAAFSAEGVLDIVSARPFLAAGGVSALAGRVSSMDPNRISIVLIEGVDDLHSRHGEAVRSLLEDHCVDGEPLSQNTVVVAEADREGRQDFLSSTASAIWLDFHNNPQEWCAWAVSDGIDPHILATVALNPDLLSGGGWGRKEIYPTPAKWRNLSDLLSDSSYLSEDERAASRIAAGIVGNKAAAALFDIRRLADRLPGVADLSGQVGRLASSDMRSAVVSAARAAFHAKDETTSVESGHALLAMSQVGGAWTAGVVLALRWMAKSKPPAFLDSMFQAVPELMAEIRKFGLD